VCVPENAIEGENVVVILPKVMNWDTIWNPKVGSGI
jgi:hypothetical protein